MSEGKRSWEKSDALALISEWKRLPELWDRKCRSFRNRTRKNVALLELAAKFGTTGHEITRKLHNLRTQYHAELRKIKIKSIDTRAGKVQSSWEYFDVLTFMSRGHSNSSTADGNDSMSVEGEQQYEIMEKKIFTTDHNKTPNGMQSRKSIKIAETDNAYIPKEPAYVINRGDKPADDFQIFGDYVASELRNLRSAEDQHKLKLDIQKSIIRASEANIYY